MAIKNLHREITHTQYGSQSNRNYKKNELLKKKITQECFKTHEEYFQYVSDEYIVISTSPRIIPALMMSLAFIIYGLFAFNANDWVYQIIIPTMCSSVFLFNLVYLITIPHKERILNRKEGTITFPGFMWEKTVTMRFDDLKFSHTSSFLKGVKGRVLLVLHPGRMGTSTPLYIEYGETSYEDMAFLTWYMDRNRPLPPGEAFDAYRQKDFERRKAQGFPKPLYPSLILTPEAIPEQP